MGAIVIDATFAGQKVKNARAAGENAGKVAYEEYGALAIGIFGAGLASMKKCFRITLTQVIVNTD